MSWKLKNAITEQLGREVGFSFRQGSGRIGLLYPSPYRAGMSSLGFQWVHKLLSDAGFAVERSFLPDDVEEWRKSKTPLLAWETLTPLSHFPVIGISLAYELELAGLIEALELAGIPPLRKDRTEDHPRIILGGPITFSNPLPAAPFVDAMIIGEAEAALVPMFEAALSEERGEFLKIAKSLPGGFVPEIDGVVVPDTAQAEDSILPARSHIITPDTELSNMHLVEGERGCHRTCSFCVMRRSSNGGMRLFKPERVLATIPDEAKRVGLVGAAISDHPGLIQILETLIDQGREVGVSSLRADRVFFKPKIPELLRKAGYRTLTVASDAASMRLRRTLYKGTTEKHLLGCAELAAKHRYKVLKVYMMVGVPDEQPQDIEELISFTKEMAKIHPIALGIAPFVPKRNTPMDTDTFAGIKNVERTLKQIRRGLSGVADVRPTSARWAWVEAELAQGGPEAGEAVYEAVKNGGVFSDYKRAFKALDSRTRSPWRALECST